MNLYKITEEQLKEVGFNRKQGSYYNYELNFHIRGAFQQTQFKGYYTFTLSDFHVDNTGAQIGFGRDVYELEEFIKSSFELFIPIKELGTEECVDDSLIETSTLNLPKDLDLKLALKREDVIKFRNEVLSKLEKYKI